VCLCSESRGLEFAFTQRTLTDRVLADSGYQ
jgi:hypothetical protein